MRLSFLAIPLIAAPVPLSAAEPRPAGAMPLLAPGGLRALTCPATTSRPALNKSRPATAQKLSELPPANAYLSVYRKIDGCEVPVVARYGIGGARK